MPSQLNFARIRSVGAFALAALLLFASVTGCSQSPSASSSSPSETASSSASPSSSPSASAAESAPSAPETRLFTDGLGREVEIPVQPQRVVVSEFSSEALTVGVKPIGLGPNDLKNAFTQNQLTGIDDVGDPPNAEKILDLKPDLIIFSQYMPEIYPDAMAQIEKIAPVVYINFEDPIYDVLPTVADVLGKADAAKEWIQAYEAERAAAREQVKEAIGDKTVSIFRIQKGRLRIYLSTNFGGYALRSALEAKAPAAVQEEIAKAKWANAVEISLEKLPEYAGDIMLLIVSEDSGDQEEYKAIRDSALWQSLPAVKNGDVHLLDTLKYYNSDIVTVRETMKEMANMLAGSTP